MPHVPRTYVCTALIPWSQRSGLKLRRTCSDLTFVRTVNNGLLKHSIAYQPSNSIQLNSIVFITFAVSSVPASFGECNNVLEYWRSGFAISLGCCICLDYVVSFDLLSRTGRVRSRCQPGDCNRWMLKWKYHGQNNLLHVTSRRKRLMASFIRG